MLNKKETLSTFKNKIRRALGNFKNLTSSDQNRALQFLDTCFKDLRNIGSSSELINADYENQKTSDSCSFEVKTEDIKMETVDSTVKAPSNSASIKLQAESSLNIFSNNYFNLQVPIVDSSSESEKEESHKTILQKHLNSIVERLENDETLLQSDNDNDLLETNYTNSQDSDKDISLHRYNSEDFNKDSDLTNTNLMSEDQSNLEDNEKVDIMQTDSEDILCHTYSDKDDDISVEMKPPLKKTVSTKVPDAFVCMLCRKRLKSHNSLIEHIFEHTGTQQSCLKCKNTFGNAISYNYHSVNKICNPKIEFGVDLCKNLSIQKLLYCPYCGNGFSSGFNLRRHIRRNCDYTSYHFHHIQNSPSVNECSISSSSPSKNETNPYKKPRMKKVEKHECLKCDKSFMSKKLFREHNATHKQATHNKYVCEACDMSFPIRALYRVHMRDFKNSEIHINFKKTFVAERVWCKVCVISFANERTYERHTQSESHLKMSNSCTSGDIKTFICEKCGQAFKNKCALTGHRYKVHKDKALIFCDQCPYSTTIINNMTRHKNVNHKKEPKKFACDKCPSLFDSSSKLKIHFSSFHSQERPFQCEICHKEFKSDRDLKKHKVIHDLVFPFPCSYCTKKFKRRPHLQRHLKAKHQDDIAKKSGSPAAIKYENNLKKYLNNEKIVQIQPTITSDITNLQSNNQMFSLIDVQSGELVLLSVDDMSKNNVINMTVEGDLLNSVHIPDLWDNTTEGLYPIDPMLQGEDHDASFVLAPERIQEEPIPLVEVSKEVLSSYIPNYIQLPDNKNIGNIEMLANDYNIIKPDILTQNNVNPEMVVTNHVFDNCSNLNHLTLAQDYSAKPSFSKNNIV